MPEPSALVVQLSTFFSHLVDLIPARLYRSENEESRLSLPHMKKAERLAAQQELKAKGKMNKRAKLAGDAPDGGAATLAEPPSGDAGAPPAAAPSGQHAPLLNIPTESVTRSELQQRLHQRLEAMQQQRKHTDKPQTPGVSKRQAAQKAKDWKQKQLESSVKAKQQQEKQQGKQQQGAAGQKRKADGEPQAGAGKKQQGQQQQQQQQQQQGTSFAFPKIEIDDGRLGANKHGKKPRKEVLLKIAEAKQKEKQEAGAEGKPKQEAWKAAIMRASGDKVLDDPKLLRKSLKKEQKRKEKSSKGWQERTQHQQEQQSARQSKRKDNIQSRIQGRADKKKNKREKKLLRGSAGGGAAAGGDAGKKAPRAGFEGRRSTFIGDKGGK